MKFRGFENSTNHKPEEESVSPEKSQDEVFIERAKKELAEEENFDPTKAEVLKRAFRIKFLCKSDEEMVSEIVGALARDPESIRMAEEKLKEAFEKIEK